MPRHARACTKGRTTARNLVERLTFAWFMHEASHDALALSIDPLVELRHQVFAEYFVNVFA
jgi:hypothetical protein